MGSFNERIGIKVKNLLFLLMPFSINANDPFAQRLRNNSSVCQNPYASHIRHSQLVVYNSAPWIPVWRNELEEWRERYEAERQRIQQAKEFQEKIGKCIENIQKDIDNMSDTESDSESEG